MTKSPWLCLVSLTSRVGKQCRGDRDRPLQGGRRRLSSALGRGDTAVPGVQRTPYPSRVSHVRNMGTSSRSTPSVVGGRPTARGAELPWREQDAQEANAGGRKATGGGNSLTSSSAGSCRRTGRIPGARWPGRESVLTWAGEPLKAKQPKRRNRKGKLDADGERT